MRMNMAIYGEYNSVSMARKKPVDQFYLIKNGVLSPAASYMRGGSVIVGGENFPLNTPPRYGNEFLHNGQITHDSPAYDISPITRPDSGTSYGSAASSAASDNGLTTNFVDERGRWLWDVLDGVSDGEEELLSDTVTINPDGSQDDRVISFGALIGGLVDLYKRYNIKWSISNHISGTARVGIGGFQWGPFKDNLFTGSSYVTPTHPNSNDRVYIWADSNFNGSAIITSCVKINTSPATGSLIYKNHTVYPSLSEWQTIGDKIILIGRQVDATTVEPVFYVDKATGKYMLTDGTNTAVSPSTYTPGFPCDVSIKPMGDTMRIDKDNEYGAEVPFVGTLLHGADTIKFNVGVEDIISVTDIYGLLP